MSGLRWLVPAALLVGARYAARSGGRQHRRAMLIGTLAAERRRATVSWPRVGLLRWWHHLHRRTLLATAGALCALGAVAAGAFGVIVGAAVVAAAALSRWAHRLGEHQRYDRALIVLVDAVGRQLRSGATVAAALTAAGDVTPAPVDQDIVSLRRALDRGATLEEALRVWAAARPRPTVQLVCGALALGAASGGLRARVIDELAQSLRQLDGARREAAALAGQAEASAAVMVVAPLAFAALLAAGDPLARRFLTSEPLGLGCLALGLSLDLVAAASMARIVVSER